MRSRSSSSLNDFKFLPYQAPNILDNVILNQLLGILCVCNRKTITDERSTALLTADTVVTVYTVDIVDMAYTVDMFYTVDIIYTVDMVYTFDIWTQG